MKDKLLLGLALIFFFCSVMIHCSGKVEKENPYVKEMDQRTKLRFRQYMVMGKQLYLEHCANCHGEKGEGLARLIPPLAKSDYLMSDVERAICQIRNGVSGAITVNGVEYDQKMAGHPDLRTLNIAEIITYITNSWGNEKGLISTRSVESVLGKCADIPNETSSGN